MDSFPSHLQAAAKSLNTGRVTCTTLEQLSAQMANLTATGATAADVEARGNLLQKILVFMYDLMNSRSLPSSAARLNQVAGLPCFMGPPYFSDSEVQFLKSIVLKGGASLEDEILGSISQGDQRRIDTIEMDGELDPLVNDCAAYDIQIVLERVFEISTVELMRGQSIFSLLRGSGIDPSAGPTPSKR